MVLCEYNGNVTDYDHHNDDDGTNTKTTNPDVLLQPPMSLEIFWARNQSRDIVISPISVITA